MGCWHVEHAHGTQRGQRGALYRQYLQQGQLPLHEAPRSPHAAGNGRTPDGGITHGQRVRHPQEGGDGPQHQQELQAREPLLCRGHGWVEGGD